MPRILATQLEKVPVKGIFTTEPFEHFPAGTFLMEIWEWIEAQGDFCMASHLQGPDNTVNCPYHG